MEIATGCGTAQKNLGGALGAMGRFAGAERVFRRILETDANNAETWSNLGLVLALTEGLEEEPACREARRNQARLR